MNFNRTRNLSQGMDSLVSCSVVLAKGLGMRACSNLELSYYTLPLTNVILPKIAAKAVTPNADTMDNEREKLRRVSRCPGSVS